MLSNAAIWSICVIVPVVLAAFILTYLKRRSSIYSTNHWAWDDIISLVKGYSIIFLLCFGMSSFISARISLPKPTLYDICDYSLSDQQCTKVCDKVSLI